ncbi:hypothetical protein D3C73_524580 [compost metagenome]
MAITITSSCVTEFSARKSPFSYPSMIPSRASLEICLIAQCVWLTSGNFIFTTAFEVDVVLAGATPPISA